MTSLLHMINFFFFCAKKLVAYQIDPGITCRWILLVQVVLPDSGFPWPDSGALKYIPAVTRRFRCPQPPYGGRRRPQQFRISTTAAATWFLVGR
jgi:hypothetical protein